MHYLYFLQVGVYFMSDLKLNFYFSERISLCVRVHVHKPQSSTRLNENNEGDDIVCLCHDSRQSQSQVRSADRD